MKHNKRLQAFVGGAVLLTLLYMVIPLNTMISEKSTAKRFRMSHPAQIEPERYKNELVRVKTSDNTLMELPRWQIDQMKVLQVLLVHQKGENSKNNPVDAAMITSDELKLLQKALNFTDNLEVFRKFYANLSTDQKRILINVASLLEAQDLISLLAAYTFPVEVQKKLGASTIEQEGMIATVVDYLRKPEKIPLNHKGPILSIAISSDGKRIISGAAGMDHNLILYDLSAGKEIKDLVAETIPVTCVAFSPDGQYIAAGSEREVDSLIVWNGITGETVKILSNKPVNCLAFSLDSNYIIAGSEFSSYYKPIAYNVKSGEIISTYVDISTSIFLSITRVGDSFQDFRGSMGCVAFRPHGDDIVLGTETDSIRDNLVFYDSKTYKRKTKTFEGMRGKSYIAFSVDGKYLVGSDARRLILWNAETSEKIKIFNNPQPLFPIPLFCVAFHPSGQYVAASCRRYVYLFSCKTGMFFKRYGKYKKLNCIAFSPDGNYLFCGTNKSLVVFKMIDEATLDYIATQLNLAQARLLYRLYQAKINKVPVMLDKQDADYQIYLSLPQDVQKVVKAFLTFTSTLDVAEKEVQEKEKMLQEKEKTLQEKMNELRSSLFYVKGHLYGKTEKMREQKIKALKDMMQKLEKDSVDYKACVKLLDELELEAAFETD